MAWLARFVDFLLPPLCANCETPVAVGQALCAECWKKITFISPPFCACCGEPFSYDMGASALCGACLEKGPLFSKARSALMYDAQSRGMILRFKHADRHHLALSFATWMKRAGGGLLDEADLLAPVPLHRWRLLKRRANQAALLAQGLAQNSEKPIVPDLLRRVRATASQGKMGRAAREKNVKGAFILSAAYSDLVKGKNILLIDDVLTTGATLNACAKVLLAAGAVKVNVLTLARAKRTDGG